MKEIFAATCYTTLMIQRIRSRGFIGKFVRFILAESHEQVRIVDFLVQRLSAKSELRLATLHFFHALVSLDCEDVMLALAFQYLLPCKHVMLSQKDSILQAQDLNCLWAAKFLSLIPTVCTSCPDTHRVSDPGPSRERSESSTNG